MRFIVRTACTNLSCAEIRDHAEIHDHANQPTLYQVDPNLEFPLTSLPRRLDALFNRLRLEVAHTRIFLYRVRRSSSPDCDCGETVEDVDHLLIHFPRLVTQRTQLDRHIRCLDSHPLTVQKILGHWPTNVLQKRALVAVSEFLRDNGIVNTY